MINNLSAQMENFSKIQSQLETIVKIQFPQPLQGFDAPNSFGTYKESGGRCLGVVGDRFVAPQPTLILDGLMDCGLDLSKLTYHEMKGGSKVRFQVPLKSFEFQNARKIGDLTDISLCIQTGFDGLTKTSLYLYTHRLICLNGAKATTTEFQASFKNVAKNQGQISGLCADVSKAVAKIDDLQELYQALDRVQVNQEIVNEYLKKVMELDVSKADEWAKQTQKRFIDINESIDLEFGRTGATLFGLYNSITHYTNHVAIGSDSADYIFTETGASMNDKALTFVSALV